MLARVLSAAVSGVEAFPVEVEVNSGWADTIVVLIGLISPIPKLFILRVKSASSSLKRRGCHYGFVLTDYRAATRLGV
jgi:hypothetical protein